MLQWTDKEIEANSNDRLVIEDTKHRGYNIKFTNETILDRSYGLNFKIDYNEFKTIAQYLAYKRCLVWQLPSEICDYVYKKYSIIYPIKGNTKEIPFEREFMENYYEEVQQVSAENRAEWHNSVLTIAANCIYEIAKQKKDFKSALIDTKNFVVAELSDMMLWGICTNMTDAPDPRNWQGENIYGRALMLARDALTTSKLKAILNKKIF